MAEQVQAARVIHIVGASGSGTSALGRALEQAFGYKWLDTDHYFWLPTDPPFTSPRPHEERISLLAQSVEDYPRCVVSGSLCGWGDVFIPQFDMVVFLYAPADVRVRRLEKREYQHFGRRIREGGDMCDEHRRFIAWAGSYDTLRPPERCVALHEEWLARLKCPVLRLDGTGPVEELVSQVAAMAVPGF